MSAGKRDGKLLPRTSAPKPKPKPAFTITLPCSIRTAKAEYRLRRKLGAGSFGEVFAAECVETSEHVAVKVERADSKIPQLKYEAHIYDRLYRIPSVAAVFARPILLTRITNGDDDAFKALIMERLGHSIGDLFENQARCMPPRTTVVAFGLQALARLEALHAAGFLHRDVKPDNFLLGLPSSCKANVVHLIDFGLSKTFRDRRGVHISYVENKHMTGTPRYATINNHLGIEQSRRDDLESLGYVLLHMLHGKLPWQSLAAKSQRTKYKKIMEKKMSYNVRELCARDPTSSEGMANYFTHCRELKFSEDPNYDYLADCVCQTIPAHVRVDLTSMDVTKHVWVPRKVVSSRRPAGGAGGAGGAGAVT